MPNPSFAIQEHVSLAPYTTFHLGGPAQYFCLLTRVAELPKILSWAGARDLPVHVLGAGANTLISDRGVAGLVIVMADDSMVWTPPEVVVGAGVKNGQLIAGGLRHGLGGLRWLLGVPGTIGGSLFGNAGGHGWGLGDQVVWVETMNHAGQIERHVPAGCAFTYRHSFFKDHRDLIIIRAKLSLPSVEVAPERARLAETSKLKNASQPTTAKTAGCMFTNATVDKDRLPDGLGVYVGADGQIAAWRLIQAVGLQEKKIGQIQISPLHANFMINLGGGTADQVMQLISLVKQQVRDQLGVQLHEEVQYLGFE